MCLLADEDTASHITVEDSRETRIMDTESAVDMASNDFASVDLTSTGPIDPFETSSDAMETSSDGEPVETSSAMFDPDETISGPEEEAVRLVRNGYDHNGKHSYDSSLVFMK